MPKYQWYTDNSLHSWLYGFTYTVCCYTKSLTHNSKNVNAPTVQFKNFEVIYAQGMEGLSHKGCDCYISQ